MADRLTQLQYQMSQGLRVAWFGGHYALAKRLSQPVTAAKSGKAKSGKPVTDRPVPGQAALSKAIREIFARDLNNIQAGRYAPPHDQFTETPRLLEGSLRFLRDLPRVERRRRKRSATEVRQSHGDRKLPAYYLQNFHFQTDGYLSDDSARLYDFQVEALFGGTADAMRRQALLPLGDFLKGKDQRTLRMVDVAAGTGRFLSFVKDNFPRLPVTALDLSGPYLGAARDLLKAWPATSFLEANAEDIPLADKSCDIVSCIYLFHELPPRIRPVVAAEMARIVKPGGIVLFGDSLQHGDIEGWDGLLDYFPAGFHEPFYAGYLQTDLPDLFKTAGLAVQEIDIAFLTKFLILRKMSG